MKRRSLVALNVLPIALILGYQFPARVESRHVLQAPAAEPSGTWRLDKVTVNDSGLANQPTWTVTHSDGSLSSSIPFVSHSDMGDTTGTWEGTNSWDSPPLLLYPGVTVTTTLAATDSCTAVNGNTSSHHTTNLFVDGTQIGHVTASSRSDAGPASESKTLTWSMAAGTYPGQRADVIVSADLGVTQVAYTYEYVWQSTDIGQLANPPEATATTVLSRQITVTGYDGSDTLHTPLTYLIRATQIGEPLADQTVYFQFFGDLECLAGQYGVWDSSGAKWISQSADFSEKGSIAVRTDSHGYVAIRALLDFSSMKKSGKQLPCTETLRAAVPRYKNDTADLLTADATVTIRHPVFVTGVFFRAARDPQFSPSPWIPLGLIANQYADYVNSRYEGDPTKPGYPVWTQIAERILIEGKRFNPPALDRSYYFPVSAGADLNIRMCNDTVNDHAFMAFEDGIAVTVMWMDGATGVFTQVRKDTDEPCGLRVTFSPAVYSEFETNNPATWTRFWIGQVGDWAVKGAAWGLGTVAAGPEAGAAAGYVVETIQDYLDHKEVISILRDNRTLVVRSDVSVSTTPDGLKTLYNFDGAPAVVDDTGKEVVAAPGEAIDYRLTGPVSAPEKRDPPAEALALQALTAPESGLTAATFEELGLVPSAASANPPVAPAGAVAPTPPGSSGLLLCGGAALLVAGAGLLVLVLALRSRATRQPMQRPGTSTAVPKTPSPLAVWLSAGIAVLGLLCLGLGMLGALLSPPASSLPIPAGVQDSIPSAAAHVQETPAGLQPPPAADPSSEAPAQAPAMPAAAGTFRDDFSSPSTGWVQVDDASRMLGYSEGSKYGIALKSPGLDSWALIPHGFHLPLHEADLYFRIRPVEGRGYFGVYFDYQDANNLAYIAVTDGTYSVGRFINGAYQSFLSSTWSQDPHIASDNGEFQIQLHCGDTVALMVNGYTLPAVKNPSRTLGDIAIFAHSHKDSIADPAFNYQVLIDDLELKAR